MAFKKWMRGPSSEGNEKIKLETVLQEDNKMENGQVHVNFRMPLEFHTCISTECFSSSGTATGKTNLTRSITLSTE